MQSTEILLGYCFLDLPLAHILCMCGEPEVKTSQTDNSETKMRSFERTILV